jgi:excisionase family DNA binding protein
MSAVNDETVLPPVDADALGALETLLASSGAALRIVSDEGDSAALPEELRIVLTSVVSSMHRGHAVTLAPLAMRLTTQEAADVLGVSRPTLVKLLEQGRIPYETPNRHRRIRLVDVLSYQETRRGDRHEAIGGLARDAQELALVDSPSVDDDAALAEARAKLA